MAMTPLRRFRHGVVSHCSRRASPCPPHTYLTTMSNSSPGPQKVELLVDGELVSNVNPLPTTGGGGGGGIVDQGKQGSIVAPWFVQPTADGATVSLPLPTGAATAAKQDTGNASLASIDGKVATAANQTTANTALSSIDTKLSGQATAAKQDTGNASLASIDTKLTAPLNATVAQGAGSGSAATYWYNRITDGSNTMPTMDAVGRAGFHKVTDGTSTAAVKAASTAAAATDPALVVSVSPNSPATVVGAAASGAATAGNPVLIGGLDTTSTRTIRTDTSGNLSIVGAGTAGSAVSTRPLQIGGSDGTNLQTLAIDTAGRLITAPAKNAQLINTTTTGTTLKSGAGVFRGFVIQNASSGGSGGLYIYDNTAASGTAFVGMFTTQPLVVTGLNIPFSTGLTVQITTAACPILFMWD